MMGRIYWLMTAGFTAIAAHLITILYLPGIFFSHKLSGITSGNQANSFFLIAPETQTSMLPTVTAQDIVGLCAIDLSKGKILVRARVPQSLWSLTVYSTSGQQVYAINDIEAGSGNFNVELSRAKGFFEQIRRKNDSEDSGTIANIGWHAEVNGSKAIAVLWVPVPDQLRRKALEEVVKETSCQQS